MLCFISGNIHLNAQSPDHLNIISYNIFNGFEHGNARQREKFLIWIKNQKADVVALQELVDFNAADLEKLAAAYGHPYTAIVKENGYPVGVTSRFPVEVISKQTDGFWHGMLHVRTAGLNIIVTHFSPFEWKYRKNEAEKVIHYVKENNLDSCIILGDLNAHSPFDADELETHEKLKTQMRNWDIKNPQYGNLYNGQFEYSVISTFLSAGFEDVIGRKVHPAKARMSFPAAFLYKWKWNDRRREALMERLDYILVSRDLYPFCNAAKVHNGPEAEGISDHYAVSISFKFKKQ